MKLLPAFLDKKYAVAGPGFNRWLVPPAALAIHLCIGMAYGFSVFWLPLSSLTGVACPIDTPWWERLFLSNCDWTISMLGWMYTLFFIFLGSAAALWGSWLEREGPRKAGFISALCWCGGLLISAAGIYSHQLWLMWIGSGVIGGIGLGLGYISPISTLIKWFPDHRGMATGMAIMGFGGGAMIGSPLANLLMNQFSGFGFAGTWQTFCVLAAVYFIFMTAGALSYRIPAEGWKPAGFKPRESAKLITTGNVDANTAIKTKQFRLLWIVLCMNVTAGIGILGMASPLLQEIFGGSLISLDLKLSELSDNQKKDIAAVAAGFTGLLSLFNILGRFFWSTLSDRIGRKNTYTVFLALGCILYWSVPVLGRSGNLILFVAGFCMILSMYGGGFATIPAYLADLFGTKMVSAIHGRLLTAWSTAGILGPVLVNYLRDYKIARNIATAEVYNDTMYVLGALLIAGLIANLLIKPVDQKYFMAEVKNDLSQEPGSELSSVFASESNHSPGKIAIVVLAWLVVLLPLAWGFWMTMKMAAGLRF